MLAEKPRAVRRERLSQRVHFERDGTVSIASGKVELGQGILTALAQIAAEELGCRSEKIRMLPASTAYSPDEGVTSGSLSIQDGGKALRAACAELRALMLGRAAKLLGASVRELGVEDGHDPRRRPAASRYWETRDTSKARSPARRQDTAHGLPRGRQQRAAPRPAGEVRRAAELRAGHGAARDAACAGGAAHARLPRLLSVGEVESATLVRDGSFVGVLAEREEDAIAAAAKLRAKTTWERAPAMPDDIHAWLKQHVAERTSRKRKSDPAAKARGAKQLQAAYTKQYIAHASIGPSCAIARWKGDKLEVWTHSQGIFGLRQDLAKVLRMNEADIVVTHVEGAGCYGHNGADDVALDAALLARGAGGRPVRLQWMRDDEFAWEPYGAAMAFELEATLDAARPHRRPGATSSGATATPTARAAPTLPTLTAAAHLAQPFELAPAVNPPLPAGGADRNAHPALRLPGPAVVNHYVREMPLRSSSLRSLGAYGNVFAIESFMDECAAAAGIDPVAFRLKHLQDPRAPGRAWRSCCRNGGAGSARRAAATASRLRSTRTSAPTARCVAEVEVTHELRCTRLVAAVDVGCR